MLAGAVQADGLVEAVHDVLGFDRGVGLRGQEQAGVIVDQVEDLDVLAGGESPVGDVCLPCLVCRSASKRISEERGRASAAVA
jgi:hypothetical protein